MNVVVFCVDLLSVMRTKLARHQFEPAIPLGTLQGSDFVFDFVDERIGVVVLVDAVT